MSDLRVTNIERAIALLKASGAGPLIRGSAPRSTGKWDSLLKSLQGALRNARRMEEAGDRSATRYAKPQAARQASAAAAAPECSHEPEPADDPGASHLQATSFRLSFRCPSQNDPDI